MTELVTGTCWAQPFGGCSFEMTAEHLLTQALFGRRVRIESQNAPWLAAPTVEMSIRQLAANILCRGHNNELGRTADWAAIRLVHWLRQSHTPTTLPGSRDGRLPSPRRVSGVNFGRWLCKTHCNLMTVNGLSRDADYARYAFLRTTLKRLHFQFVGAVGESVAIADPRDAMVRYTQFVSDEAADLDAFMISLAGFTTFVAPFEVLRNGEPLLDRVRVAQWPTPLGMYQIAFDWSNDPGGGDA